MKVIILSQEGVNFLSWYGDDHLYWVHRIHTIVFLLNGCQKNIFSFVFVRLLKWQIQHAREEVMKGFPVAEAKVESTITYDYISKQVYASESELKS